MKFNRTKIIKILIEDFNKEKKYTKIKISKVRRELNTYEDYKLELLYKKSEIKKDTEIQQRFIKDYYFLYEGLDESKLIDFYYNIYNQKQRKQKIIKLYEM